MPCLVTPSSSQTHTSVSATTVPTLPHQTRPVKSGAGDPISSTMEEREERLLALLKRTGYSMVKNNGQRKYGGPPPEWVGPPPSRGSEVFVGKLPRDIMEDELVPLFERCGTIYELRHMMDFSGTNRGFAYVRFSKPSEAVRAIDELNNFEIRPGQYIGVMQSVDNCRLFVGGIPRNKARDEIFAEMSRITENVVDVILKPCAHDKSKNRGFAFVEYETHRDAAMARRKLVPGKMQLWGQMIAVDWAEPEQEVDSDIMARVKILYISNLMLRTTEEVLRERVERICPGCVERVKKLKDYAFVHFSKREDAEAVLKEIDGTTLDDAMISAEWAKPPDKSLMRFVKNVQKGNGGTGLGGMGPTGSVHHNLVAAATELYSSSTSSAQGRMLSTLTEANGIPGPEYFLEGLRGQRGAAGLRGAGIRQAIANAAKQTGVKYTKQFQQSPSAVYYDYMPGFSFLPAFNPFALRPFKTASQILEDCCVQCRWGVPQYSLQTTVTKDVLTGGTVTVFEYKITVPALVAQQGVFQCGKLCGTADEAKELAAFHALQRLGLAILPSPAPSPMLPSPIPPISPIFPSYPSYSSAIGSPLFACAQPPLFSPGLSPSPAGPMHPMYFPNCFAFPPTPTLLPPPKLREALTNSSSDSSPAPHY